MNLQHCTLAAADACLEPQTGVTDETAGKGEQSDGRRQVCLNLSHDQSVSRTGGHTQRCKNNGDGQILNHVSGVGLMVESLVTSSCRR